MEKQILKLISDGLSHRQIRDKLGISLGTISRVRNGGTKVMIVYADAHVPYHHKPTIDIMYQVALDIKPDTWANLGDGFNADGISKYTKKSIEKGVYETAKEMDYFKEHIHDPFIKSIKPSRVIYTGGNHCFQRIADLKKDMTERGEETELIEHFMDKLSFVKRFPSVETCNWNDGIMVGKLFLTHGFYYNDAHAKKTVINFGCNVLYGHVHSNQSYALNTQLDNQPHQAISLGCSCDLLPDYKKNAPSAWQHSFAVVYFTESGEYNLYIVNVINNKAIFNGKLYTGRNKELSQLVSWKT